MNRYVAAFAAVDEVTLSVVSADPVEQIEPSVRKRIAAHYRIRSVYDVPQLVGAVRAISRSVGKVDRLAGVLEAMQEPLAAVRDALDIEGVRSDVARNFRDKDRMKQVLREHDVPVARSVLAHSLNELRSFATEVGFPVVLKPRSGVGGQGTSRIDSMVDLLASAERHAANNEMPLQVEEFVRARELTCETVTVNGVAVWGSGTRYYPSPLEVLESPWQQYCVLLPREDPPELARFHDLNRRALKALFGNTTGTPASTALTHMEWFHTADGRCLVNEVGIRPPGAQIMPLMSLAHATDLWRSWAQLVSLDRFDAAPRVAAAGVAFFRGQGTGARIASVEGVEAAIEAVGDSLVELRRPRVGQPRSPSYEGEGFAIIRSATTEGATQALLDLVRRVRVHYA